MSMAMRKADVGEGGDGHLHRGGDAHPDDLLEDGDVKPELLQGHPTAVRRPHEQHEHQHRRDALGQDGGVGHARHAHAEDQHEEKVQGDVERGGQNQEVEGALGVAHGPEDACAHVVEHEAEDAGKVDGEIPPRLGEHLGGRLHEGEHIGGHPYAHGREHHAQQQRHHQGGVDRFLDLVLLFGAVVLGDDHARARGQAHEEADEHVQNGVHRAHGAEGFLAHVVAHHPGVHGVVELLEQVPQQQRHGEPDQEPIHVAPGHVHVPAGEEGFQFDGGGFHRFYWKHAAFLERKAAQKNFIREI